MLRPSRSKASNRIGAAASRPIRPGRRAVVGPPDPDRDRRPPVEADRQRVAKAVGRAGLEGDPAFERVGGRRRAAQDVRDVIGRDRIGHPARADDRRLAVEPLDQRRRLAAAREAGVEAGEVGERDPEAAKADGEADRRVLRQRDFGPGAMQPGEERRRSDVGKEFDRRKVERHLQRLARRHRAFVAEIEILRRVGPVAHRPVEQPRLRMGEALLESQRIDEGFQRRARRAGRARHVDRAVARGVVIIGCADPGADLARRIVDDDDRRRQLRPEPRDALFRQRLELRLQAGVDRELDALWLAGRRRPLPRRRARRAPGRPGAPAGTGSRFAAAASAALIRPRAATRSSTRSRAARAALGERSGRRASGDCGSATRSAASASVSLSGSLPK